MREYWKMIVGGLALFGLVGLAGCEDDAKQSGDGGDADGDADGDTDADTDSDTDSDTDTDSDSDTETETDTGEPVWGEPCEEDHDPDNETYDYGPDYPPGPYGFKTSLCWSPVDETEIEPRWGGGGDTLHDICLPNQDDQEVCIKEMMTDEHDLLVLVFTAVWCPYCNAAGDLEDTWIAKLEGAGWNPFVITVVVQDAIMGPAVRSDAELWKDLYELENDVLYDPEYFFVDRALYDRWEFGRSPWGANAFPFFFYVRAENMRVWDAFSGFTDPANFDLFVEQELEILDYCAVESGLR